MIQAKVFAAYDPLDLEEEINTWLQEVQKTNKIEIVRYRQSSAGAGSSHQAGIDHCVSILYRLS